MMVSLPAWPSMVSPLGGTGDGVDHLRTSDVHRVGDTCTASVDGDSLVVGVGQNAAIGAIIIVDV